MIVISCTNKKERLFDINKYITLSVEKVDYDGKIIEYVTPKFVDNNDSISQKIKKNLRRYRYLLTNKTNLENISSVMPDSTKAKSMFSAEINGKQFKDYFYKTFYARKEKFTKREMMDIASKFFLVEKVENTFGTRICIAINGLSNEKKKDFTLLEAIIFEAIFAELRNQNQEKPQFVKNLEMYRDKAVSKLDKNVKDSLLFIRNSVFNSMENDSDLSTYLLNYIKKNDENVAVEIIK